MGLPPIIFGTTREHYILLFGAAGSFGLVAGLVGAWIGARFGTRAALRQSVSAGAQELASKAEVHELATSVDAVLLEIERVGEAQRFVAKILAERAALPPASPPSLPSTRREPGQITPH